MNMFELWFKHRFNGEQLVIELWTYLDHEKLRQDGNRLQIDWECPQDLQDGELLAAVQEEREKEGGADQKLDPENCRFFN